MTFTQIQQALGTEPGTAYYTSPFAPLLVFPTPFHQPGVIPPLRETSDPQDTEEIPEVTVNGETWFPTRSPDRVEWDGVRGGLLAWTSESRTKELPPTGVVPSSRSVTPAIDPTPLPPPLAPAAPIYLAQARSAPPSPQQQQREIIDQTVFPLTHVPIYYTPAMPFAGLPYYTPSTSTIPLVPLHGAAPARPLVQFTLSSRLTATSQQQAPLLYNAINSLAPTDGDARSLLYRTPRSNIVTPSADILNEPATQPPAFIIRIYFGRELALLTNVWGPIIVKSSSYDDASKKKGSKGAKDAPNPKPITVGEFLNGIHNFLYTQVPQSEQDHCLPFNVKSAAVRAMERRCRRSPGLFDLRLAEGMKRVDVLGGWTKFIGAVPLAGPVTVSLESGHTAWAYDVKAYFREDRE